MSTARLIRIVSCNFELNGNGDYEAWLAMQQRLAGLRPTILCRQETFGYAPTGRGATLFGESKRITKLAGDLGPGKHATALYYDPKVFDQLTLWDTEWPGWLLHPTAMTLRVRGTQDVDVVVGCAHLSYNSATKRVAEAEDLTRLADRVETYQSEGGSVKRKLPVLALGMDTNSYIDPARLVPGELPIPRLEEIKDPPHRAHRSYEIAPGERVMDSRPDRTLLTAGLEDVARHVALLPGGPGLAAVAATVDECDTHGPAHRVDRVCSTDWLLPAVVHVEVVDMTGLSDHHTVVVTYDLDTVIDLYRARFALTT
ncbi:hypothetical protein [Streptomyces fulvoviolaceus]|uniref:hypothetical protein n=1 Tax=Streptomyces fulvoviolaceus TaxID=285535 RepID=UPI0021C16476|nr:hypothetical protein [Streptomyces fulvoviolaceus]MCT9075309.1 hypothetical protein [Streptomyces fulvoviolaceus]